MDANKEEALLEGIQKADPEVLVEIYDSYSPGIYAYSIRLLGDADMAEECVSETFSRFLQAVHNQRGPHSNLRAYLYRIAHNWITDYYRRKGTFSLDELEESQSSEEPAVADNVDLKIRRFQIRKAISRLPDIQRQVIILSFLEGWEENEIAAAISKSVSAVKAIQFRAIVHLRNLLLPKEADK